MIQRARELMKQGGGLRVKMDGHLPEWMTDMEKVSVQEKILVLCLMDYYLHTRTLSFHYACVGLFEKCFTAVSPRKILDLGPEFFSDECKKLYPDPFKRICILLGTDFEKRVNELIDVPEITEADIEPIAVKLYQEYYFSPQ